MNDSTNNPSPGRKPGGVFIAKGMSVGIPEGGLTISIDGKGNPTAECKLIIGLDVTHHWLQIAFEHACAAKAAAEELDIIWSTGEEGENVVSLLEREFSHGMQAIGAAAFAVDAFYASVVECVSIPEDLRGAWRRNKTSRPVQIMEVFRRGFRIGKSATEKMQEPLRQLFRFRDKAVHPKSNMSEPIWHPRLNVGMEWRFVIFREENARLTAGFATSIVAQLVRRPKLENELLRKYCAAAIPRIDSVLNQYENRYGKLFDRAAVEAA